MRGFIEVEARATAWSWNNERKEMVTDYKTIKKAINVDYIVSVSDAGITTIGEGFIPTKEGYDEIIARIGYFCEVE